MRGPARTVSLLALGAVAVHQARLLGAPAEEVAEHVSLVALVPVALAVLAVTLLGRRATGPARTTSFAARAARATALLLVAYVAQELLEGLLVPGHGEGLGAAFAEGGWLALPLALGFGLLVAGAERGLELILTAAPAPAAVAPAPTAGPKHPRPARIPRPAPLAALAAGRAPPPPA